MYDTYRRLSMAKKNPTTAELEILSLLWQKEPLTVKEIHQLLTEKKDIGYTTALKIMQNMTQKGLLRREPNGKSHLYFADVEQNSTQETLINKIVDTAFSGSASNLVMQLLGNKSTSEEEIDAIKDIIKKLE